MGLLGAAGAGEEVVEDVEVAFPCWDGSDAGALEAMVEQLSTDQAGGCGAGGLVLELEKEACFGGGGSSSCFGGGEGVEDVCGEGELLGERGCGFRQNGGEEM